MRKIIFISILLISSMLVNAQEQGSFRYYDSLTYDQYNNGEWALLSGSAKEALSLGYDYYYMRMRIGISFYERAKYLRALKHFKKALEFNVGDQIALEYIYYCYYLSNKLLLASRVSEDFGPGLIKKTGLDLAKKNRMSVAYLYSDAHSEKLIEDYSMNFVSQDAGAMVFPQSFMNIGLSLNHNIAPGISINHSLSYLNRTNLLWMGNGFQTIPEYTQTVKQLQYTFSPAFASKSGLSFSPVAYYLNTSYNLLNFVSAGAGYNVFEFDERENNLGAGFNLGVNIGRIDLGANTYASKLGNRFHFQAGSELTIFPLANSKFYLGAGYSYLRSEIVNGFDQSFIFEGRMGFLISNRVYIDLAGISGELNNYIDNNGFIIYNGINNQDRILKADISFIPGESGLIIYLGARLSKEYSAFIPEDYLYASELGSEFNSISILGGLSWNF